LELCEYTDGVTSNNDSCICAHKIPKLRLELEGNVCNLFNSYCYESECSSESFLCPEFDGLNKNRIEDMPCICGSGGEKCNSNNP